jgi:phenylalanyl-tRNA synthetase beta chain
LSGRCSARFSGSSWPQWSVKPAPLDFYDVKAIVDAVLAGCGFSATYRGSDKAFMHPGRSADVLVGGQVVGLVGALHPRMNKLLDLPGDVFATELACRLCRGGSCRSRRYRASQRAQDLALLFESVSWGEIEQCIRATLGAPAIGHGFDQYHGSGLQAQKPCYGRFYMTFRAL